MPHDSIDLELGGLFTCWEVHHRWCLTLHASETDAMQHAHSLVALNIAHPVYIGTLPSITARVAHCYPDLNPEGP